MQKQTPKLAWLIFIVIQALIGTSVGLFALSNQMTDVFPEGTTVGSGAQTIDIGKLSDKDAKAKLNDYFNFAVTQGNVNLSVEDKRFSIPYKDMDLKFDADKTLQAVSADITKSALGELITGEVKPRSYPPVITLNSGKLAGSLEKLFKSFEKVPVPDLYKIADGQLVYTPRTAGIKIDYPALAKKVAAYAGSMNQDPLVINPNDGEIFTAFSGNDSGMNEVFNTIVSSASISVGSANQDDCARLLDSFGGKIFSPGQSIKLSEMTDLSGNRNEGWYDRINRVTTAVYQAFLPLTGINVVNRRQADIALPYSEAGLEAVIDGENGDLELENATGHSLMILGELRGGFINLYVVSTENIPCGVLIAQKKDIVPPPVIYNVKPELKKGESNVIIEGSDGFTVNVGRVVGNDREELYSDRYDPVSRVVDIGNGSPPLETSKK